VKGCNVDPLPPASREEKEQTMNEVNLPQGTIRYRDLGNGKPIVFVHGLLANGELWRDVAPRLAADFRVIVPDWPLGSQELAMNAGIDLSPPALAQIISDFLSALELEDVTLVGNDTGGAICQLLAVSHPERIGRLVLTPCDAYENFLPPAFRPLQALARIPGAFYLLTQALRSRAARRLPLAYGWLMKRPEDALTDSWLAPARSSAAIRREVAAILKGISNRHTLEAAGRFGEFTKPVLIAWAPEDRFFKFRFAERLAHDFPDARLEKIEDSYTFVSLDQPGRTAELIAEFAREPARRPASVAPQAAHEPE
jgi:pimeloyl-ACP methyl ester carboxylesterase